MKMKFMIAGIAFMALLAGLTSLAWEVFTVTDPYVVGPLSSSPAPASSSVGHSVGSGSRILSVVSSSDVVVVADPGASFQHEVLWLVELPRKDGSHALKAFRFDLPQHASVDQIRPLGSAIPPGIQQTAEARRW